MFADILLDISHSGNETSLAYSTARTRWPKIIEAAIADVDATVSNQTENSEVFRDGKDVVKDLKHTLLKMQSNARLAPIPDDGAADIEDFNAELDQLGPVTWHSSPWLYCECYLYRLVQSCFSRRKTSFWKVYDVFAKQKRTALRTSKAAFVELTQWYLSTDHKTHGESLGNPHNLKALMEEMIQISLWGNATDLLLLISVSVEELQSRQGRKSREKFKENVVDDDTEQVWDLLSAMPHSTASREIHIVLDNAGFEFVTDLVFVAYLLAANYATRIVLHGKAKPWFVSDVTVRDLEFSSSTLEQAAFSDPVTSDEAQSLKEVGSQLRHHVESGRLRYEAHPFWTTQHPYARMAELAPDLHAQLAAAELVVFKGDLNYRKLVFDGLWPHTTTFARALGSLGEAGLRILALRTCKADTCVGLQTGKEDDIDPYGSREWTRTGKFAVISFFDGKIKK
ncbi:hypothetical protein MMC11_008171 [Xylographa trunciseda]|nr:hypothetical protein [Xylographa trunciseda]